MCLLRVYTDVHTGQNHNKQATRLSFKSQEFPPWSTLTGNLTDRQDRGQSEILTEDKDKGINQLKAIHLLHPWHLLAL